MSFNKGADVMTHSSVSLSTGKATFCEAFHSARNKKGISQINLSKLLGVDRSSVSRWESGKRIPEYSYLIQISKILEISLDELLSPKA